MHGSVCRKSMFLKQTSNSLPLSPLGHSDGFASCKARRVLISASLPKTPFPGKGAILLGLPPLDPVGGYAPATPFLSTIEVYRQSELTGVCRAPVSLFVEKVCFFKKSACSQSLSPLGHSVGFASVQQWSFVVGASCTDFVRPLVSIHA